MPLAEFAADADAFANDGVAHRGGRISEDFSERQPHQMRRRLDAAKSSSVG